jgi:hypothetical protein
MREDIQRYRKSRFARIAWVHVGTVLRAEAE